MHIVKNIGLFTVLAVLLSGAAWASSQEKPLATGNNFVVMPAEVGEIREQYKKNKIEMSEEQGLKLILKMRLFAAEAERTGLAKDWRKGRPERMTLVRMKELSDLYSRKLMDDYPLKDVVIESYYWAHPEEFRDTKASKSGAELKPLNDEQRKMIREKVLSGKLPGLEKEAVARLMESYHVRISGGKKGVAGEKDS